MINFTSRSFIAPAQSVTKTAPATDAATDSSKTAAAPAAPAASQGSAKSSGNQSFQSLLNAQTGGGSGAQTQAPLLSELPAQVGSDEDTMQSTAPGGHGRISAKSEVPPTTTPTPVDLASLIGAATGQAIGPPPPAAPRAGTTVPVVVTGGTSVITPLTAALAASADASTQATDVTADRRPDDEKLPVAGANALAGETKAKLQATPDPTTLTGAQQAAAEAVPVAAATQPKLEQLESAFAAQNAAPTHGAMPAVADNHGTSTPVAAPSISTPVGAEGWDQALGQRVVWMVAQRNPVAEIHVNPPNLGPLTVKVDVADNTMNATFVAAHAATRDAINDAMPHLKEMLANSGIALGQVTVSAESFSQGGGASTRQAYVPRDANATASTQPDAGAPLVTPVRTGPAPQGLVDTFA
jgi:flagellar hook-length control protein FliK